MTAPTVTGFITPTDLGVAAVVLVTAVIATAMTGMALRRSIRRIATRRLAGEATRWRWRTRMIRPNETDDSISEIRRLHRIDALALALARVARIS